MKKYVKANMRAYDILGEQYYQRMKNPSVDEYIPNDIVNDILSKYYEQFGRYPKKVLELGSGSGGVISCFAKKGCITCAIEISANMINYAKSVSDDTIFIQEDILSCSSIFKKEFDVIYAGALIHLFSLEDEAMILSKIKSWLTEEGVLFINTTLHDKSEEGYFIKEDYSGEIKRYRRKWEKTELILFLKGLGYKVLNQVIRNEKKRRKEWINLLLNVEKM